MSAIRVGILGRSNGWQLLAEQAGVPYALNPAEFSPDSISVIAAGDEITEVEARGIRSYLEAGGAVVCSGRVFSMLTGLRCRKEFISYVSAGPGDESSGIGLVDVSTTCFIPPNANALRNQRGECVAFVGEYAHGNVVVLPFDAGTIVLDRRVATKSFYARRGRLPFERVSLVTKHGISMLAARSLEILHHRRGLPYVHKWQFPQGAQTLFGLRIDTDRAQRDEIENLEKALHHVPLTWFVDVGSQEGFVDVFRSMSGHEVGVHCYRHTTYDDYGKNVENIRSAMDIFNAHGLEAKSFAAPYGIWNEGIARAVEHCGFEYSSEFSYDYDGYASFPLVGGRWLQSLQVPVHPISIGSLVRQGFSEQEMTDYFQAVIENKLCRRAPIFFYHHPRNGHVRVLQNIVEMVQGIRPVRMIDYARWWKKRSEAVVELAVDGQSINVKGHIPMEDVVLRVTRNDGYESFVPIASHIALDGLTWTPSPPPPVLPKDIIRTKKFNPWIPLNRFEDFISKLFARRT